jgi:hypothetical protein
MNAPTEFRDFCRRFHQDAFILNPHLQDTIGAALKPFDDGQRKVLAIFLSDLIESDISDADLSVLFSSSGADFHIRGPRNFFGEVLTQLRWRGIYHRTPFA